MTRRIRIIGATHSTYLGVDADVAYHAICNGIAPKIVVARMNAGATITEAIEREYVLPHDATLTVTRADAVACAHARIAPAELRHRLLCGIPIEQALKIPPTRGLMRFLGRAR